jgi:hypothetical protein
MKNSIINKKDMKFVNLGCGNNTHPDMINIDYSIQSIIAKNSFLKKILVSLGFINEERSAWLSKYSKDIILHNLAKGIPMKDFSVDAIYHSHLLEHLTPKIAEKFTHECFLKLKVGGKIRIVVPDLFVFCNNYLKSYGECKKDVDSQDNIEIHKSNIYRLIQQLVINETINSMHESKIRRIIENLFLGDRRGRGDLHLWMYDSINLPCLLEKTGFINITQVSHKTSTIENWEYFNLDMTKTGGPYKFDSIYFEAEKP